MKLRRTIAIAFSSLILIALPNTAHADSAKPGQSMTHMKTAAGVASTLEAAGVILYVQGGATAAVIGENVSAPTSQVVFHIPVTANKAGVQHVGSNIIFFNTANNHAAALRPPTGSVNATTSTALTSANSTITCPRSAVRSSLRMTAHQQNQSRTAVRGLQRRLHSFCAALRMHDVAVITRNLGHCTRRARPSGGLQCRA